MEVAADWHNPVVPQHIMWLSGYPLPALTDNWTRGAASRHTIAPILGLHPAYTVSKLRLIFSAAEGRRLS